jgi:hypothetical protein
LLIVFEHTLDQRYSLTRSSFLSPPSSKRPSLRSRRLPFTQVQCSVALSFIMFNRLNSRSAARQWHYGI